MSNVLYMKIFLLITLPCLSHTMGYSNWTTDVDENNPHVEDTVTRSVLYFTKSPVQTYVCLHIPSQLQSCANFHSDHKNHQPTSSQTLQRMSGRKAFLPRSPLCVQGLDEIQKQTFKEIKSVALLGCKPNSMPFVLPCCTADDMFDERKTEHSVYAFVSVHKTAP